MVNRVPTADSDRPRMFPDGTKPKMFSSSKKKIFPVVTDQGQDQASQQDNVQQQGLPVDDSQDTVNESQK